MPDLLAGIRRSARHPANSASDVAVRPYSVLRMPGQVLRGATLSACPRVYVNSSIYAAERLLQLPGPDSSPDCPTCRRSLASTDLESYPFNYALEAALDVLRGCHFVQTAMSGLDASTLRTQVSVGSACRHDSCCGDLCVNVAGCTAGVPRAAAARRCKMHCWSGRSNLSR